MNSVPCPLLQDLYRTNTFLDSQGREVAVTPALPPAFSEALYRTVLQTKPRTAIEIGMAFGTSSISILTALKELGGDRKLISIDPAQTSGFHGVGVTTVARAGLSHLHQLVEQPDYFALPDLMRSEKDVSFCYIDGWHTFDYTLLDWFYIDKMLPVNGVVGFNDCAFRSVHKVIKFILGHRKYEPVNVGLPPDYKGKNFLGSLQRRFTGRSGADQYFRKLDTWEPDHNFFAPF